MEIYINHFSCIKIYENYENIRKIPINQFSCMEIYVKFPLKNSTSCGLNRKWVPNFFVIIKPGENVEKLVKIQEKTVSPSFEPKPKSLILLKKL